MLQSQHRIAKLLCALIPWAVVGALHEHPPKRRLRHLLREESLRRRAQLAMLARDAERFCSLVDANAWHCAAWSAQHECRCAHVDYYGFQSLGLELAGALVGHEGELLDQHRSRGPLWMSPTHPRLVNIREGREGLGNVTIRENTKTRKPRTRVRFGYTYTL
eukprot:736895-Prymnesium_polylepis.2